MNSWPRVGAQVAATAAFALLLTGGAAAISAWERDQHCTSLVIASSNEKAAMLVKFAADYNLARHVVAGHCVTAVVQKVASGDAESQLETVGGWVGKERPDVWSPASSAWLRLLAARSKTGAALLPDNPDLLFSSPLVIAMPKDMADALGYPMTPVGWHDVFALVANPAGWASKGHPEWGAFRLGKTNPNISTSGLHALVGSYYAAGADLTDANSVNAAAQRDFVGGIEAGVDHYGPTAADFLRNLLDADSNGAALKYVSAVAVEEKELVDYNTGTVGDDPKKLPPLTPLVAIYPKEGTLVADHPYAILRSSSHQEAARDFYKFVLQTKQAEIDRNNFRDRSGAAGASLAVQPHVVPSQPSIVIRPPSGTVINAMLATWKTIRKPARVLILVDAGAPGAPAAAQALAEALKGLGPRDQVSVWTFPAPADSATPFTVLRPMAAAGPEQVTTLGQINQLSGQGSLDTVLRAARDSMAAAYDPNAINAIVVLELQAPAAADPALLRTLRAQPPGAFVRVFTVGNDSQALRDISLAARGAAYEPGSAQHLLTDVVSNF